MLRVTTIFLVAGLLGLGCGGRSALLGGGEPQGSGDGAPAADGYWLMDGGVSPVDNGWWRREGAVRDAPTPRDAAVVPDSCLPIPAAAVQGAYYGQWQGTWTCPSMGTAMGLAGDLKFSLLPTGGPESFAVEGSMAGTVEPGLPFSTSITGVMGCTTLSATLPDIVVGSGAIIAQLKGTLNGLFVATPAQQGFPSGTWTAQGGGCSASGDWQAF